MNYKDKIEVLLTLKELKIDYESKINLPSFYGEAEIYFCKLKLKKVERAIELLEK